LHLLQLKIIESRKKGLHLEPDATEKLVGFLPCLTLDTKLFGDSFGELFVCNHKFFFDFFLDNVLFQEFLECFRNFTLEELFN